MHVTRYTSNIRGKHIVITKTLTDIVETHNNGLSLDLKISTELGDVIIWTNISNAVTPNSRRTTLSP